MSLVTLSQDWPTIPRPNNVWDDHCGNNIVRRLHTVQAGDDYGQSVFRPDPILDKPGTGNRNKQSAQSDTRAENVVLMVLSGFPVS